MKSYLLGHISVFDYRGKGSLLDLDLKSKSKDIAMTDTFMCNFSDIGFSPEEKHQLTQQHRLELIHYRSLSLSEIEKKVNELIKQIKKIDSENIEIEANGFGAFLCLSAIVTNKLPKNKKYVFQLKEIPISIFPQEMVKSQTQYHNIFVAFSLLEKGWLRHFNTLTRPPRFFEELNQVNDLENAMKSSFRVA